MFRSVTMKQYFIAAAAASLFAGVASAGGDSGKAAWNTLDEDRDGVITRSEAQGSAALSEQFDRYDANRDGVLSKKEFDASNNSVKPQSPATRSSSSPATSAPVPAH
jgi:EF hand